MYLINLNLNPVIEVLPVPSNSIFAPDRDKALNAPAGKQLYSYNVKLKSGKMSYVTACRARVSLHDRVRLSTSAQHPHGSSESSYMYLLKCDFLYIEWLRMWFSFIKWVKKFIQFVISIIFFSHFTIELQHEHACGRMREYCIIQSISMKKCRLAVGCRRLFRWRIFFSLEYFHTASLFHSIIKIVIEKSFIRSIFIIFHCFVQLIIVTVIEKIFHWWHFQFRNLGRLKWHWTQETNFPLIRCAFPW